MIWVHNGLNSTTMVMALPGDEVDVWPQEDVISSGGDKWRAWEVGWRGNVYYVQECDSHRGLCMLQKMGDGWASVNPEREGEVRALMSAMSAHGVLDD